MRPDRSSSVATPAIALIHIEKSYGDAPRRLGGVREQVQSRQHQTRHAGQNSLRFLGLRTPETPLCLVLKIRVSMVRFRPRPPDKKSPLCHRSGLFALRIVPLGGAGSVGVRWRGRCNATSPCSTGKNPHVDQILPDCKGMPARCNAAGYRLVMQGIKSSAMHLARQTERCWLLGWLVA